MMNYLFLTTIYSGVLFLGYNIFLKNSSLFKERRFVLLLIPLISFLLPFMEFPVFQEFNIIPTLNLREINITTNIDNAQNINSFKILNYHNVSIGNALIFTYIAISSLLLIKFIFNISKLYNLKRYATKNTDNIYYIPENSSPYSFFNKIFLPVKLNNSASKNIIIEHEKAHIKFAHSIDMIILELLTIAFWFNPFFHLIKKEMSFVHEYQADEYVLSKGISISEYTDILMQNMFLQPILIAKNLNNSLIKNRFIMMTTLKNKNSKLLRLSGIGIVAMALVLFNNCTEQTSTDNDSLQQKNIVLQDDSVYDFSKIDVRPEFPGGSDSLINYIAQNTTFPSIARDAQISAKIYISFVINETGKPEQIKASRVDTEADQNSKEIEALKESAINTIKNMPDWKPGEKSGKKVKVRYIIPINFKLAETK